MIRRALRPLRKTATAASRIGLETLDQRLSSDGVPREIQPFVAAINQLLERLEREVARAQLLVANAAHELRTPVAILCARMDTLPDADSTRALRSDAQRLALMVDQLLAASCAQGQSHGTRVELVVLLRELIADLAPLALRGARMLAFETDLSTCTVAGQPDALRSALANLIDNAIRAEPVGGTVVVSLFTEDDAVIVEVADHGPGVDVSDRENVFEPFWRRDNHWKGTGLGLAIARSIAQAHGGTILLRETPGGGATFQLSVRKDSV
jgi:signal transduction histidine kinase